jgi:NAD(P)-dependent dehydrogenase (short-subunit alcohol dehydrogenase family)
MVRTVNSYPKLERRFTMSAQPTQTPICAVAGVGPGNGAALARRFAAEGYAVALLARSTGLIPSLLDENPYRSRPCEERSDEAIQGQPNGSGLLRLRLAMTVGATTFWAINI